MSNTEYAPVLSASDKELIDRATALAEADEMLLSTLIKLRHRAGLSQRDVADLLGIKQSSIASFERHDNDPKLSTIRRYALAVGAQIEHRVLVDGEPFGSDWSTPAVSYTVGTEPAPAQWASRAPHDARRSDFAPAA